MSLPWSGEKMNAALELRYVDLRLGGRQVLSNLTFEVGDGERFFLLGPSGCGKTTALRVIAGFESPDKGQVVYLGKDLGGVPPERRGMGVVFQQYALWPHMTVKENVEFGLYAQKLPSSEISKRCGEMLELVELTEVASRYPSQLSGGQQQRVALARALALRPKLLLLDEPLSNLDAKLRVQIREELLTLHRTLKLSMVFVTHDQEEALSLGDRIAIMNQGRIVQYGSSRELYENPHNRFVAEFLGETTILKGTKSGEGVEIVGLGTIKGARPVGASTEFSLRPEKVIVHPQGIFEGVVDQSMYLGRYSKVRLQLPSSAISLVALVAGPPPEEGTRLRFSIEGDALWPLG